MQVYLMAERPGLFGPAGLTPFGAALRALTRGEYLKRVATTRDGVTLIGCPSPPSVIPPRRCSGNRATVGRMTI